MNFWNDPLKVAADWLTGIDWLGHERCCSSCAGGFPRRVVLITILMVIDIFLCVDRTQGGFSFSGS